MTVPLAMPRHAIFLLSFVFWLLASAEAHACSSAANYPTLTVTPLSLAYTETPATGTVQFTITMPTGFTGSCYLALHVGNPQTIQSLQHAPNPQATLSYSLGAPFYFTGAAMAYQFAAAPAQVLSISMPVHIPANQTGKPSGTYQSLMEVRLSNVVRGGNYKVTTVLIEAIVAPSCTLPPPTLSALDFSAAIHNGTIPVAFQRTLSFNDAGCNGPARLTLAGEPMKRVGGIETIHYSASAILGGTPVTLDTRTGPFAFANAVSAPQETPIPLSVTVQPTPGALAAGTYRSTLRVSLEPAQ